MQFTTLALSLLSVGGALAQSTTTTVHVVSVSSSNGSLTYTPNNLKAAKGDMVQFQFFPANHTVTQSTFDQPCQPISSNSNVTGIFSGFMPVKANDINAPLYTIKIANTNPMWLYCSQGKHCQSGMVMAINENPGANATRTLDNFKSLAAKAVSNSAPSTGAAGGTASTTSTSNSTSPSSTPGSSSDKAKGNGAQALLAPAGVMGLTGVALALALFL